MTRLTSLLLLCALAGCGAAGDYPTLVPINSLLEAKPAEPAPTDALQAQADALRARADALRAAQP